MEDPLPAGSRGQRAHGSDDFLPKQINTATRSVHTHLNRLIVARLPLALHPSLRSPELYAVGLQRFAPVYFAFEAAWCEIVDLQPLEASQEIDHRVFSALKHLHIPELLRTQSLRNDLSWLMQQPLIEVDHRLEHLEGVQLHMFLEHFDQTCALKPHILIAYAWVMYMALFNGGRWIRAQLLAARNSSWDSGSVAGSVAIDEPQGLSFWHFLGGDDGEDIKNEFKARLNDIEDLLNDEQRRDVIEEAQSIFKHCTLLVGELDKIVAARPTQVRPRPPAWSELWIKHPLPLGIAEVIHALLVWIATCRWYSWIVVRGRYSDEAKRIKMMN